MSDQRDPTRVTLSGQPPLPGFEHEPAPAPIDTATGMHADYWVLSEEERAKGFVRPVRRSYKHVGRPGPRYPLRDLTTVEQACFNGGEDDRPPYVKYESFPEGVGASGHLWTQADLDAVGKGCGTVTTMGRALAETYAREPHFYGATFCCGCRTHLRVGANGEFVWLDEQTGAVTSERVGT